MNWVVSLIREVFEVRSLIKEGFFKKWALRARRALRALIKTQIFKENVPMLLIMLEGRRFSYTFLKYIRKQVMEFSKGI